MEWAASRQIYIIKNTGTNRLQLAAYYITITFFVLILQMGHVLQDKLQDHWSRLKQF
jgi:hypothetical protein